LTQIGKVVNLIQQDVMRIRMLPIELVFNAFPRMVRDLARKTNKQVEFIIQGQETGVDRTVIEHIKDPLVHLLRNAVDHGVETPQERRSAGKPETATVVLSAYHQQDNIVIIVEDNGKGIDLVAVKDAAVRKGLITAEAARMLNETDSINLIFSSGVSTANKITEVSGRGVGLDIVKKNLEPLKGTINIETKPGKGTKFILTLPLTLAIIPALVVSVKNTVFAIPLSCIDEAINIEAKNIQSVRAFEASLFRGNVLPLLRLAKAMHWTAENENCSGLNHVVVVKNNEMRMGLIVDSLIGQQEIVVKSFDHFWEGENYITGASILGDGQVTLILDVASLVRSGNKNAQQRDDSKGENRSTELILARK
jgi:two-component system chemotaxis sensor kinase CheA